MNVVTGVGGAADRDVVRPAGGEGDLGVGVVVIDFAGAGAVVAGGVVIAAAVEDAQVRIRDAGAERVDVEGYFLTRADGEFVQVDVGRRADRTGDRGAEGDGGCFGQLVVGV